MNDFKSTLPTAPDNKGDERRGHQAGTAPAFAEKSKKGSYQWDAADYASHSGAQQQWARELTARLALSGREDILDIGCGDGKVTAELATLVPEGSVTGVDSSRAMLDLAVATFPPDRHPNLSFQLQDARALSFHERFDRIFSNAALHWIIDHRPVVAGMFRALRSGGLAVVQMGGRGNAAGVIAVIDDLMRKARWRDYFQDFVFPYGFYGPEEYGEWLAEAGFSIRAIALIGKDMVHEDRNAFTGWVRTTWLPYTDRVPESLREQFIEALVSEYLARHPADGRGAVHTAMQRLEFVAAKP